MAPPLYMRPLSAKQYLGIYIEDREEIPQWVNLMQWFENRGLVQFEALGNAWPDLSIVDEYGEYWRAALTTEEEEDISAYE